MKIAHLVSTFPPYKGGMGNAAAQFAEVQSSSHEVTVLTPRYGTTAPRAEAPCRVEWLRSLFKSGNAASLPQLIWRLRSYDLIYLHYPFYGAHLPVVLASVLWRGKLVLHYHMDTLATGLKGRIFGFNRRFVLPLLIRRAEVVVSASLDYLSCSHASCYLRERPEKFREIPFWVDGERFRPGEEQKAEGVEVLFVGGLDQAHYFKGLEVLLRAMKSAVRQSPIPLRLGVVGGGALLVHYQTLATELGIADRVRFLGRLDDAALVRCYQKASFLVLPSINQGEAFGLVLLEAMACGLPVIASNLPGVRSVFSDGEEGLVARVADPDDLAAKILQLALDPELRRRMGKRARQTVEKRYQAVAAQKALEEVCRQLISPPLRGTDAPIWKE